MYTVAVLMNTNISLSLYILFIYHYIYDIYTCIILYCCYAYVCVYRVTFYSTVSIRICRLNVYARYYTATLQRHVLTVVLFIHLLIYFIPV